MPPEIIDCEQGTDEWRAARVGIPSASCFSDILAKPKKGSTVSLTRAKYLRQLAAEIYTGDPTESYSNAVLERGKAMEEEARNAYAFRRNVDPIQVGFIRNGRIGCSPDGLLDDNGGLEIKTKRGDILIECIERESFPPEHYAQVQGALLVTEREWWDLCVFWPKMPMPIYRMHRDEAYLAMLKGEIDRFLDELDALVEKLRGYKG
jgi:hypothetical protein